MQRVQIVLSSAILVVMCVVAFELVQLNRQLAPFALLSEGAVRALVRPDETRAQRNLRLQREQREMEEDMRAILTTPPAPKQKPK
jgi:hypothetical protein